MKYIAEQDRRFTDMGGVKIYHSIFPVRLNAEDQNWGPVIRFDNKVLLPGQHEVQHIVGSPVQVLRIVINGSASYYDSWGYRTILNERDVLEVNSGQDILSAVVQNIDEQTDTELLEIWMLSGNKENACHFHSGPANREKGRFYTIISTDDQGEKNLPEQKKWFRIGSFDGGHSELISGLEGDHRFILFVFNGEMLANGLPLHYRDTMIFTGINDLQLEFKKDSNVFMLEIGKERLLS